MGPPPAVIGPPAGIGLPRSFPAGLPSTLGQPPGLLGPASDAPGLIVRDAVQTARDVVGRPDSIPVLAANLARDDHGAVIVRAEILAVSPSDSSMRIAQRLKFMVTRRDNLGALGLSTATLRIPEGMSAMDALALLRRMDPQGTYDYAHIYNPSGSVGSGAPAQAFGSFGSAKGIKVGMIDGGVEKQHPAFRGANIVSQGFAQTFDTPGTLHGTAVASLLIGRDDGFSGYIPGATLYAADVFGGMPDGGSADNIARALNWMASNNIAVTNISLAGPHNLLLAAAVKAFVATGHTLVAAAGNGGPAAPSSYPAAYPGVIAVTSVDSDRHPQFDASRGAAQFAALGVGVRAAALPQGYASVTGTSYATPVVTARFALLLHSPDPAQAKEALSQLSRAAIPLDAKEYAPRYLNASSQNDPRSASADSR